MRPLHDMDPEISYQAISSMGNRDRSRPHYLMVDDEQDSYGTWCDMPLEQYIRLRDLKTLRRAEPRFSNRLLGNSWSILHQTYDLQRRTLFHNLLSSVLSGTYVF